MEKLPNITSVETKAGFREKMVEKFVKHNLPPKVLKENKISGMGDFTSRYNEIECCAAELPVHGSIEVLFSIKNPAGVRRLSNPVTSRFIVFCTREEDNDYRVTWSCSLS